MPILCVYEKPDYLSLTSKCQLSPERRVLDLESEVHERPGFYSHIFHWMFFVFM